MKNLNKILFITIVAALSIVSCTKDDDRPTINYSEFLAGDTEKTWTADTFTLAGSAQECRLDDSFTFNKNNTYNYDGGDLLCGDEDNQSIKSGTWHVDNDAAKITFDRGTDNEYSAQIESAENGALVLTGSYFMMTIRGNYSN